MQHACAAAPVAVLCQPLHLRRASARLPPQAQSPSPPPARSSAHCLTPPQPRQPPSPAFAISLCTDNVQCCRPLSAHHRSEKLPHLRPLALAVSLCTSSVRRPRPPRAHHSRTSLYLCAELLHMAANVAQETGCLHAKGARAQACAPCVHKLLSGSECVRMCARVCVCICEHVYARTHSKMHACICGRVWVAGWLGGWGLWENAT